MTSLTAVPLYRAPGELREKLVALRDDMLDRMRRRGLVEPGHLPIIAGIAAALDALAYAGEADAATHAAIDDDGDAIRLVLFRDGTAVAAAVLAPTAALTLAGELMSAAGIRLADELDEIRRRER